MQRYISKSFYEHILILIMIMIKRREHDSPILFLSVKDNEKKYLLCHHENISTL